MDLQHVHTTLCHSYNIGYLGLYNRGTHMSVYIQGASKNVRMAPGKVFKICKEFGALSIPQTFKDKCGVLVTEIGVFKKGGAQKGSRKNTASSAGSAVSNTANTTNNNSHNTNSNNITNNDNSVNNTVHVHIHAVGKEDVSRITMDQFKELLGGGKEAIIEQMKKQLSGEAYQQIIEEAWHGLQKVLLEKKWNEREAADVAQAEQGDASDEISDDEGPMMTPLRYSMLTVNGEPLKYDGQHDSEYNQQAKDKVSTMSVIERSAVAKSYDLPHEFAELMYNNPHNCNVKHATNSGSFEYFDGTRWTKKRVDKVHSLVENWGEKAKEFNDLLKERHGSEWSDSFDGTYASHVIDMFKYQHPCCANILKFLDTHAKQCALLAIENANKKIKDVHTRTGKRMHRVLSESDFEVRDKKVLRATSWEKLWAKS